jgi:hypothetical protein
MRRYRNSWFRHIARGDAFRAGRVIDRVAPNIYVSKRTRAESGQNELPSLRAKRSHPCLRPSALNRLACDLVEMDGFASLAMTEEAEPIWPETALASSKLAGEIFNRIVGLTQISPRFLGEK